MGFNSAFKRLILWEMKHQETIWYISYTFYRISADTGLYRVIKKSLWTWWLQYKKEVHRELLIILYNENIMYLTF